MVKFEACNPGNITAGACNTAVGSVNLLENEVLFSDYGYIVSNWSAYFFMIVFAVAFVCHLGLGLWKRQWWCIFTLGAGAALETIGWGGRVMSVLNLTWDSNAGGYYRYDGSSVVCTIIAPTFYSAANYILLGKLIATTGGVYSILTPKSFAIMFMFADFLCLVIQGAGGGIAGTAATHEGANNGAYIMTGGVALQLLVTILFVGLLVEFAWRYQKQRPAQRQRHILPNWKCFGKREDKRSAHPSIPLADMPSPGLAGNKLESQASSAYVPEVAPKNIWIMVGMLVVTTLLIVVRSVYRTVELTDGWTGPIAVNQDLFLGLDAFLMLAVVWLYVPVYPGFFLPRIKW